MKYEYAVQCRLEGEDEWSTSQMRFQDEKRARDAAEWTVKMLMIDVKTRIVRRPVVEWEVVE